LLHARFHRVTDSGPPFLFFLKLRQQHLFQAFGQLRCTGPVHVSTAPRHQITPGWPDQLEHRHQLPAGVSCERPTVTIASLYRLQIVNSGVVLGRNIILIERLRFALWIFLKRWLRATCRTSSSRR
jgi:hypothetical protein